MDTIAIGAEMPVSDLTLSAGYSTIDSDQADRTTMGFGVETSDLGDYTNWCRLCNPNIRI